MSITLYNEKGSPLTVQEMDTNFSSLLPKDGSGALEGNLTIQGLNIFIDNTSNTLTIGSSNDTIEIPGTLSTTAELNPTVNGKTFTVNATASTKPDANGAGLKVGTNTVNLLYNSTTDAWEATTNISGEGVNMKANDFLTDAGGSLSDTISDVSNLEMFTGSMGSTSASYGATNYLTNENDLQSAIIKLDNEVKNTNDVFDSFGDLSIYSRFIITSFEERNSSLEAVSGVEYIITPSSGNTVDVTLPESNKGKVAVRLSDKTDNRKVRVSGNVGDSIENQGSSSCIIDQSEQTYYFIWDTTNNTWRIR